jgi:hypothetical protein
MMLTRCEIEHPTIIAGKEIQLVGVSEPNLTRHKSPSYAKTECSHCLEALCVLGGVVAQSIRRSPTERKVRGSSVAETEIFSPPDWSARCQ